MGAFGIVPCPCPCPCGGVRGESGGKSATSTAGGTAHSGLRPSTKGAKWGPVPYRHWPLLPGPPLAAEFRVYTLTT